MPFVSFNCFSCYFVCVDWSMSVLFLCFLVLTVVVKKSAVSLTSILELLSGFFLSCCCLSLMFCSVILICLSVDFVLITLLNILFGLSKFAVLCLSSLLGNISWYVWKLLLLHNSLLILNEIWIRCPHSSSPIILPPGCLDDSSGIFSCSCIFLCIAFLSHALGFYSLRWYFHAKKSCLAHFLICHYLILNSHIR